MSIKNICLFLVMSVAAATLLSSCMSPRQPPPVSEWVLSTPDTIHLTGIVLDTLPFVNYSEVTNNMMYRVDEHKVEFDPYNRWAKSPNILLLLYVKRALNIDENYTEEGAEDIISFTMTAAITVFEIDLKNSKVKLGVSYTIRHKGEIMLVQNTVFEEDFKNPVPEDFAKAMSSAAAEFVKTLTEQLYNLKTDIINKGK